MYGSSMGTTVYNVDNDSIVIFMLTFNKVVNKSQQSFFSKGSSQKEVSVDIRVNVDMDSGKIKLTVPGDSRQNVQKSPVRPILNQKPTTTSTQHPFFG